MGSYKEIEGNLLTLADEGHFDFIIHGCNCFNTLADGTASGIAAQVAAKYMNARAADAETELGDRKKLGAFSISEEERNGNFFGIVNAYTQFMPGRNYDYDAIRFALKNFVLMLEGETIVDKDSIRIGLPLIGCGVAGGEWGIVKPIIQQELKDFDVTIVHYKK